MPPHNSATDAVIPAAECGVALRAAPASCRELFRSFAWIGLSGFGGVLPWARRMLVERKQWLTDLEFAELLSMGQLLPGPNISNLAVILGRQYFGIKGAFAAASGLYAFPFCIILMLGWAYQRYGQLPIVQHMLNGVMPVSAGLVIATALKLLRSFPRTWHTASFMLLA